MKEMIRRWAEGFRPWDMIRQSQGLTVLSVEERWIKLLQWTGRGARRNITTLLAHPIDGMSDEEVLSWLKEAALVQPIDSTAVLIANPTHLTTARLFTLPSTDPTEIREIVELQAEKHTPYAKEEILSDFRVVETDPSGYSRVLLIISHQDVVYRSLRLIEGIGWPLERVGFELEGLVNWFQMRREAASPDGTLVAELDSDTTTLVIFQKIKPYFHRSLALGAAQLLSDSAEKFGRWVAEFQRSLETFEAEGFNVSVSRVVLTGLAGQIPGLAEKIQQGLNLPTSVVSPFEQCPLTEKALKESEAETRVSFAGLLGLALRPSEVDLTPKALRLHRTFEVRSKALVGVGCQLIAGLLLFSCLIIGKAYKNERYHEQLMKKYQEVAKEAQLLEAFMDQLHLVQGWLDSGGQLLESVAYLAQHTPSTIRWSSLHFTKDGQIILKGSSEQMPKVFDFVAAIEKSPLFSKVEARHVAKKKDSSQDLTEFEIVCLFVSKEASG